MENVSFYVARKIDSVFSGDNIRYVIELRGSEFSRVFYNKGLILINEFFRFLSFFSPNLYFKYGLLIIFFPFWFLGIIKVIREKRTRLFLVLFTFGTLAFLIDQRSLTFLFPIGMVYVYLVWEGLRSFLQRS